MGCRMFRLTVIAAILVVTIGAAVAHAQNCPTFAPPQSLGMVQSSSITEASGIAVSRQHENVLWIHNDSGDSNRIFAMTTTGAPLGTFILSGATAIDWEDIAIGPAPPLQNQIYVGDIGDNLNFRNNIVVYRVAEPATVQSATLTNVATIRLAYPDGPRDAETLMVDTNGDIYIVSKRLTALGRVYRAPYPQSTSQVTVMQFVAELPWGAINGNGGATGGDISADGSAVIVRRVSSFTPAATLWRRGPGTKLWEVFAQSGCDLQTPSQPQGESIAFAADLSLFTVSEGAKQPIYYMQRVPTPGDVNGDDLVNVQDLLAMINAWGPCPPPCPPMCAGDFTDDCTVNVSDLLMVINNWG